MGLGIRTKRQKIRIPRPLFCSDTETPDPVRIPKRLGIRIRIPRPQCIEDVSALNNYSYQTAVHVFQKKEFAFENVIGTVGKILVGVGIGELVLDDVGTCVDQPCVGDDSEFFHLVIKIKQV